MALFKSMKLESTVMVNGLTLFDFTKSGFMQSNAVQRKMSLVCFASIIYLVVLGSIVASLFACLLDVSI